MNIKPKQIDISSHWGGVPITTKLSLAFGLLLLIVVFETTIGYVALTNVWKANNDILDSLEIQRLGMGMSRNWESLRRLRHDFFYQAPIIGADQAYELHALPASGILAEIIRDGVTLNRYTSAPGISDVLHARNSDVQAYLSEVNQYSTSFQESTDLELLLTSDKTGLQSQLSQKSAELYDILNTADQSAEIFIAYYEMRNLEKDYINLSSG